MSRRPIFQWLVNPARPLEPAHAYLTVGTGVPFRGECKSGTWTVKTEAATAGPLCPDCRELVAGDAFRVLETITDLEDISESDLRALRGDR